MSFVRGSSVLSEKILQELPKSTNVVTDLMVSTFYTVMGYVCLDIVFAISLHYVSEHNTQFDLAGVGLAFTIVNVLLIPMSLGTNQSLNVHSAQALGAGKPKLAQTYFSLTIIFHLMYFIPISVLVLALKQPISLTINESDRALTSDACQMYLYFLLPSTIFAILYEAVKSFMIAHKIFSVFMYIQLVTTGLHILWCEIFINYLNVGGGIQGAGIAVCITEFLNCFILVMVIICSNYKDKVFENYSFKITKKHKKIFLSFARTSFPIIAHIYADFFVFFLLNFIAISFNADQLNAQLALSNTSNVYYKFPISLSLALMTYIGNEMGQKNIKRAKHYAWVGVLFFVCFTTVFLTLLSVFREQWAVFYAAKNVEVKNLILDVYPIFVFGFFIIDGLQGTLTGILKGIERKDLVTYSTLLVYYPLGIPLVLYMSCGLNGYGLDWKVYGIWFAFSIINAVLAILYLWVAFVTNWEKQSDRICNRVEHQHQLQKLDSSVLNEVDPEVATAPKQRSKLNKVTEFLDSDDSLALSENRQIAKEQQRLRDDSSSSIGSKSRNISMGPVDKSKYMLPGQKKSFQKNNTDTV